VKAIAILIATLVALGGVAYAAPRKVLVLKLDGSADPAERERLQAEIARLAANGDVEVTSGNTTLAETASAVGCDPAQPACLETVRQTLGVDEIAYGTADTSGGETDLVVHHLPAKDQHAKVAPGQPLVYATTDKIIAPVFDADPHPHENRGDRNLGIAMAIGGGVAVLIGLTLWSQESSTQDTIDMHATNTTADLLDLKAVEDRASSYAWFGNAMFVIGLGLGGAGAYFLYKDHKAHSVVVAPMPNGVAIGGVW
jgi:hypothetical protein